MAEQVSTGWLPLADQPIVYAVADKGLSAAEAILFLKSEEYLFCLFLRGAHK